MAIDVLRGPLHFRGAFSGDPMDERYIERVLDIVMRGLAPEADR